MNNVLLAKRKLSSLENITSKTLKDTKLFHEEFMLISIEVEHYCIFKEIIRLMECQRSDTEKDQLIKDGKRIRIYEMNKQS